MAGGRVERIAGAGALRAGQCATHGFAQQGGGCGRQHVLEVAADHLVVFPAPGSIAAQVKLGDSGVRRYSSAS